eukprot:CAMPEP_0197877586 /NCGR_PEP_ID=MMETSP1439-20131203/6239_1 /TAXON_ID=66791 /ORGANISM="Gonyaulax spinifera, Strain CCMP409" /LENGTH=70 /DNA_ID=CAMNT_0043496945 /DNA_START=1 /DNA_END=210 /DNA_ORIENTATION=+
MSFASEMQVGMFLCYDAVRAAASGWPTASAHCSALDSLCTLSLTARRWIPMITFLCTSLWRSSRCPSGQQ